MSVVLLRLFVQLTMSRAVNHAAMHWDRFREHSIEQTSTFRLPERVDASFGQGKVDGFGKVERDRRRVSQVLMTAEASDVYMVVVDLKELQKIEHAYLLEAHTIQRRIHDSQRTGQPGRPRAQRR